MVLTAVRLRYCSISLYRPKLRDKGKQSTYILTFEWTSLFICKRFSSLGVGLHDPILETQHDSYFHAKFTIIIAVLNKSSRRVTLCVLVNLYPPFRRTLLPLNLGSSRLYVMSENNRNFVLPPFLIKPISISNLRVL